MLLNEHDYPHLYQFFGIYCNQDYDLEYGTFDNAVSTFVRESTTDELALTCKEIGLLVEAICDDDMLLQATYKLQNCIDPTLGGYTVRQWLTSIQNEITKHQTSIT